MKPLLRIVLGLGILGLLIQPVLAASTPDRYAAMADRDLTLEQDLRWQSSADRDVTPQRVLRYLRGERGNAIFTSAPPIEFVPIVQAHDGRYQAVGTIAYKF